MVSALDTVFCHLCTITAVDPDTMGRRPLNQLVGKYLAVGSVPEFHSAVPAVDPAVLHCVRISAVNTDTVVPGSVDVDILHSDTVTAVDIHTIPRRRIDIVSAAIQGNSRAVDLDGFIYIFGQDGCLGSLVPGSWCMGIFNFLEYNRFIDLNPLT